MKTDKVKAAVWYRVSTEQQELDNQVPEVEAFCRHHGYEIVKRYQTKESAWNGGRLGGEYQRKLQLAQDDAWKGEFTVLVVWAVDRLTRGGADDRSGAEDMLRLIRLFRQRKCTVVSVQESWLNGSPEAVDVLVAFAGWAAEKESQRRSKRIRAAIKRRKAAGTWTGRGKDTRKRRTSGYLAREARKRNEPIRTRSRAS